MKKCYLLLALSVLLCQVDFAQFKNLHTGSSQNDLAYNNTISANYDLTRSPFDLQNQLATAAHNNLFGQLGTTGNPTTGSDYDVKYYRLELRINPDTSVGNYVKGKVTTYFKTKIAGFSSINFDMAAPLICDAVFYHGVKVDASNISRATTDAIKITIPTLGNNVLDSVSISYEGVPPAVIAAGLNGTGFVTTKHNTTKNYVYTLSEPYSAYTWWPCKSYIVGDKADSLDLIISTPTGFKAAGNGKLVSETTVGSNLITTWKERYPISSYQVCTAVANFVQYPTIPDTVVMGSDRMPVYNWIFPETNTAAAHTALDRVPLMITTFNALYGDYPFKKEKYGNYTFGFGGGMEHNTFSGESASGVYTAAGNWDILAHELGHQWWGDNVTCGTWSDIWLHESFADFSEALTLEFAPSIATDPTVNKTAAQWRATKKANSVSSSYQAKTTIVLDTSTIATIFSPSVYIYDRGGMIITMLRTLMGDTKFFNALRNYQSDPLLKLGNGFTNDVKRNMEAASGMSLSNFFTQWLTNTGYGTYSTALWNNSGNNITLKLIQNATSSALTHFDMPVVARIQGSLAAQDTTVIIYDIGGNLYYDNKGTTLVANGNLISFKLSFTPTTVTFDPFAQTLGVGTFSKSSSVTVGTSVLAEPVLSFTANKQNSTANLNWNIDNATGITSFDVERSTDGINFKSIGIVDANNVADHYSFLDNSMAQGNNYYRIKVFQRDGSILYTKTILLNDNIAVPDFTVSPNPARDYIVITGHTSNTQTVDIKIIDASGRQIKNIAKQTFFNNSNLKVPTADLGTGSYFIEIISASSKIFTKQISIIR